MTRRRPRPTIRASTASWSRMSPGRRSWATATTATRSPTSAPPRSGAHRRRPRRPPGHVRRLNRASGASATIPRMRSRVPCLSCRRSKPSGAASIRCFAGGPSRRPTSWTAASPRRRTRSSVGAELLRRGVHRRGPARQVPALRARLRPDARRPPADDGLVSPSRRGGRGAHPRPRRPSSRRRGVARLRRPAPVRDMAAHRSRRLSRSTCGRGRGRSRSRRSGRRAGSGATSPGGGRR